VSPLDGNAIGGLLLEIFSTEMTAAIWTCGSCGSARPVAEAVVYLNAPGTVVRCRSCTDVLMIITSRGGVRCVGMPGLAALAY
jgi:Family of unknown function (DUF6510)